ncbi:MAG: TRAP transporter small permease subunit [Deltaproteobacteria bacterium]|nr:TRAP transporter small permease subunit [Candidatus Anaeroferrophillus wilburensis]
MLRSLTKTIDKIVVKQAEASSLIMAALVVMVCYEVVRRYFFNAPTIWGLELTTFMYGVHFVMGYGYTEYYDGHVRVDIFSSRLPRKIQDILYIVLTILVTLPLVTLLGIWAWDNAITSTKILEELSSAWAPPIWPVKLMMALGFTFLFLQVLSNLIKRFLTFGQKEAVR